MPWVPGSAPFVAGEGFLWLFSLVLALSTISKEG